MSGSLDLHLRGVLGQLADLLIPAGDGMPAATQVGVPGPGADEVLALRPDLLAPLTRLLTAAARQPEPSVKTLRHGDRGGFDALTELVAGAYLIAPEVQEALGYDGRPERPLGDLDAEAAELLELASPLLARGPLWRDA